MVVDDEAAMRAALEASFRRDGWGVTTATGAGKLWTRSGGLLVHWWLPTCACPTATDWR